MKYQYTHSYVKDAVSVRLLGTIRCSLQLRGRVSVRCQGISRLGFYCLTQDDGDLLSWTDPTTRAFSRRFVYQLYISNVCMRPRHKALGLDKPDLICIYSTGLTIDSYPQADWALEKVERLI